MVLLQCIIALSDIRETCALASLPVEEVDFPPDPHFSRLPNTDIFAGQITQETSTSIPTSTQPTSETITDAQSTGAAPVPPPPTQSTGVFVPIPLGDSSNASAGIERGAWTTGIPAQVPPADSLSTGSNDAAAIAPLAFADNGLMWAWGIRLALILLSQYFIGK